MLSIFSQFIVYWLFMPFAVFIIFCSYLKIKKHYMTLYKRIHYHVTPTHVARLRNVREYLRLECTTRLLL